ncbi:hypothetical protein CRG98_032526 [Punica granatum]|uniref:Disease resistance protein RGA3 n=1 Tax=Punica granatum TaxID=22663 RepID=A0A2I0ITP3_PUNGR|nr:hypothetical protein CRG98_032526 [Punica granatum]
MADLILGSIMDSITEHLVSLIAQQIGLTCGVKRELKKLQGTVSAIAALLREAEKRRIEAEDVKDWLQKLKVVLVYACMMAHRVKEIRERIDAIKSDRSDFKVEGNDGNTLGISVENQPRPETSPYEHERYVVGRDEDIKEVIKFLLNPDFEENVSILPIVGIGGLGKTTLARQVFNNESIKEYFSVKLWVCVSTNFDAEEIMRKIVRESTLGKEHRDLKGAELIRKVREELDGKKFLLALDDVWNENRSKWLELEGFLMNGAKGSKILVTTRHLRVAKTMKPPPYYELRGLLEDQSLALLMRMAGKQEHEWKTQNLEEIAKEILKKCAGVPLAIKTIGRLLVFLRDTEEDWLNFKDNDLSTINQEEGDIMPSLKLSYDFLPSHLKQCFAYCCLFPKDYELDPSELIHLWMAQGFIKPLGNRKTQLEDVGHDYFMELLLRSFFQDIEEDPDGNIVRCKMHDLMHDLAQNLRALRVHMARITVISSSIGKLKHMRSLDLSWNHFQYLPNSISGLCNLETLNLRGCWCLERLPRGLTKLVNLRQLDWIELSESESGTPPSNSFPSLEEIRLKSLPKFRGWERRRTRRRRSSSRIEQDEEAIQEEEDDDSLLMLPLFSHKVKVTIDVCPTFSYMHASLSSSSSSSRITLISPSSISLLALTGLTISEVEDLEHLPVELFQSLPSLQSLAIKHCPRLKGPPVWAILRYLTSLESLTIIWCPELDLSTGESGYQEAMPEEPAYKLRELKFGRRRRRRSSSRIEQEEEAIREEDDDSLLMLPLFSHKVKVTIDVSTGRCPKFSYMHGQKLHLMKISTRIIKQLLRNVTIRHASASSSSSSSSSRITLISLSSISPLPLTRLTISEAEDLEHLPVELLQSLPSLQSLAVSYCPRLKALPGWAILRYLTALESLTISNCPELDLSMGESGYQEDMPEGPAYKLRELEFLGIGKMKTLPWWIQHLTNLESLKIAYCNDLNAFPEWFPQLTSLKRLHICLCGGELRRRCRRNIGEDWPKISHIPDINVSPP